MPFDPAAPPPSFTGVQVPANAFEFSSDEKNAALNPRQWLSVWHGEHTTPEQAQALATEPKPRLCIALPVDAVRAIAVPEVGPALDIVWDPQPERFTSDGDPLPDVPIPAGAAGHCALEGLGKTVPRALTKRQRHEVREMLGRLASRGDTPKHLLGRATE